MTDTPDDLVKCVFWLAIDEDGDYVVTIDGANLGDEAGHLMPGYRTIEVTVRARPPTDARWLAEYVPGWESVPARWELRDRVEW
jgi:hypothetical protein